MFSRSLFLVPLLAALSLPVLSQDAPSLGDVARRSRSERADAQPKKVITNDEIASSRSPVSILGLGKSDPTNPNSAKGDPIDSALASLSRWESVVKIIDSLDRATLVKGALQGANPDFPGHASWEDRFLTAKQTYVSAGRDVIQRARQLLESARTLQQAKATADDPRVKELNDNVTVLLRESVRADAAFQAVILEGRDLARQAVAHPTGIAAAP